QEPIDDSWRLQIQYLPETEVKLGTNLDPNVIREGSDVYFDCKVDAVPPVYKVEWRYNGRPLPHNVGQGVIISNLSLVLQGVSRTTAGNYTCVGFNAEGDAPSKPFQLNVLFAPTCRPNQPRVHGVAKQERARVRCSVEANPPQVTFRWTFNNSAESIEVAAAHVARARSEDTSVVTYTPVTELDYGTLLCWATNSIGSQRVPCVYHIIAAGRPDQVHNCTVTNVSLTSLTVRCSAGFDGGLPQSFLLEARDSGTLTTRANLTSPVPRFAVAGLNPGGRYLIGVYAFNAKGRGEPVVLQAATLRLPEKQLTSEKEPRRNIFFRMTPALSLTIGAILAIITVALLVAAMLRLQRRCRGGVTGGIDGAAPKHGEPASPGPSDKSDTMTSGGGVHAALLMTATGGKDANGGGAGVACPDDGLAGGGDERGPDVVADAEADEQAEFLRRQPTVATIAAPRGGSPVISQCCRIGGMNMNIPPSPLQRIPPGEQHMILNNQTLYPARAIPRHMWPSYGGGVAGVTNMYHGPPPSHVNAVTSIPMRPLPRNSISRPMTSLTEEDNSSDLSNIVKRESTV
ncbi:uncharacterized protein LOC113386844, partial [Ctenocephalides felis]|uniref:uncharacterized protein LOC113386844 n=1 Tax=Ctenocephalides felis TaxID=7515 RepID=UPI000E6E279E